MFKRAHLYACTAPVPGADADDAYGYEELTEIAGREQAKRIKRIPKGRNDEEATKGDTSAEPKKDEDVIQWMPGNKVAKCKFCPQKTMLNQDAVQKHLDSKAHKRAEKRALSRKKDAEDMREQFMRRMEAVEEKAIKAIAQQ
ncbi:hypothetical protein BgAZ_300090 [Babesia gibsoni]|uniref:U1-type domain-containing protein n=1 Tax=Babesia gibsoni TaxID=33632 RepID=A0AAD8LNU2_BABGI|nr:hypothetical protein BgAZ_300090 [Babesia gibsoni]